MSENTTKNTPTTHNQIDTGSQIRELVENWARAVRDADMDGVLAHHADNIVMFDVPPPLQLKGIDAYRKAWELFFSMQGKGAFDLGELEIAAGDNVAFCHSIVTCGSKDKEGQFKVCLTIGLRKISGNWMITHEHHSVPAE
jgi:ketosteroid isomerase-like protein